MKGINNEENFGIFQSTKRLIVCPSIWVREKEREGKIIIVKAVHNGPREFGTVKRTTLLLAQGAQQLDEKFH